MEERQQAEGDHKFKNCDNNIQSRTHFFLSNSRGLYPCLNEGCVRKSSDLVHQMGTTTHPGNDDLIDFLDTVQPFDDHIKMIGRADDMHICACIDGKADGQSIPAPFDDLFHYFQAEGSEIVYWRFRGHHDSVHQVAVLLGDFSKRCEIPIQDCSFALFQPAGSICNSCSLDGAGISEGMTSSCRNPFFTTLSQDNAISQSPIIGGAKDSE